MEGEVVVGAVVGAGSLGSAVTGEAGLNPVQAVNRRSGSTRRRLRILVCRPVQQGGSLEGWKFGRMEDCKVGRLEGWKVGEWKVGDGSPCGFGL